MTHLAINSVALVVHELENKVTAFVHDIHVDAHQRYVMGSGRVLSRADKEDLVNILTDKTTQKLTLLPERLLAKSADTMIWWRPAGEASLGFERGVRTVKLPPLLFCVQAGELRVAAMKCNDRPTVNTVLYHSGFPNVDSKGHWCSGGNRIPEEPRLNEMHALEKMFLVSPFTHDSTSLLKNVSDLMAFWQSPKRANSFSVRRLISMETTLQDWIDP